MRPASLPTRMVLAVLSLTLAALAGCSDDDGGIIEDACMTFAAAATPASGRVVARDGADSTCDVVQVELVATDIAGVFSAAFSFDYDNISLLYSGIDVTGSQLASDGNVLVTNSSDNGGTVTVGISRNGSQSTDAVDFSGTQLLVTVFFTRLVSNGDSDVTFTGADLFDNSQPPAGLGTPPWAGGRLTIN